MAAGILSTILDTTGERVRERIAQSHEIDKEMRDTQTDALLKSIYAVDENGQPRLTDAQMEEAWGRIEKLHSHNKSIKDILGKAKDITQQIFSGGNKAMAGRAQQQTQDVIGGGQGGPLVSPPPQSQPMSEQTPIGGSSTQIPGAPYTPPPPQRRQPVQQAAAAASAAPVTPAPQSSMSALIRAGSPDLQKRSDVIATTNAQTEKAGEVAERQRKAQLDYDLDLDRRRRAVREEEGRKMGLNGVQLAQYVQGSGSIATKPFNFPTAQTGKTVSEMLKSNNRPETDASGQAIDPNSFYNIRDTGTGPEGITVTKEEPDYGGYPQWAIRDSDKHWVSYQRDRKGHYPPKIVDDLGLTPPQGLEHVGTNEVPVIDAEGNLNLVQTNRTNKPVVGGQPATTGPAKPATTTTPPIIGGGGTTKPPATTSSTGGGAKIRTIPGVLPAAERDKQLGVARPIRAAAVQLFGDPKDPSVESLATFAHIADDAGARERVGKAARLIIQDLGTADTNSPGVAIQALGEGISASGGDIWTAIKNISGITGWVAKSEFAKTEKAIQDLKPEEYRYLNQVMSSYGTLPGLRAITKGSALKFSTQSMERELPIIGFTDVPNSKAYNNKLSKLATEIGEGVKGISDAVLPEKAFYVSEAKRLGALGRGDATQPPARTSTTTTNPTKDVGGVTYYKHGDGKWYLKPE